MIGITTKTHPQFQPPAITGSAVLIAGTQESAEKTLAAFEGSEATSWRVYISPDLEELAGDAATSPPDWVVVDAMALDDTATGVSYLRPWRQGTPVVAVLPQTHNGTEQRQYVEAGATIVLFGRGDNSGNLRKTLHLAELREEIARSHRSSTVTVSNGFPLAFYRINPMGELVFANNATARLLGYPNPGSLVGMPLESLFPTADGARRFLEVLEETGRIAGLEVELTHRSGRRIWVQLHAHTVQDHSGATTHYEGGAVDVTARRQAFHAAESVQHRLESFFDRSQTPHWIEDFSATTAWLDRLRASGVTDLRRYLDDNPDEVRFGVDLIRIVDLNPAAIELIGARDKEEVLTTSLSALNDEEGLETFKEQLIAAWDRKSSLRIEGVGRTLDGRRIEFVLTWVVTVGNGSDIGTVIVSVEDRTELNAAQRRLAHLSELKDRFIDSITHELRTPLTGILGFSELLRQHRDWSRNGELDEYLDLMSSAAASGAAILDNMLLSVELNETGTAFREPMHFNSEDLDLIEQARSVAATLNPEAREMIHIDDSPARAVGDPNRVRQILRNLLENATRYGEGDVRVATRSADGISSLSVIDNGTGIDPDSVARAFRRYESMPADPGLTESLGLGLTVSRVLAEAMGGSLTYDRFNEQTTLTLSLQQPNGG